MREDTLMGRFLSIAASDPRIGPNHISMFAGIAKLSAEQGRQPIISVFRKELMPLCKLRSSTTYYRAIRELQQFGYIQYIPSYNHFLGNIIRILVPKL